jgi:hypothetical protein
MGKHNRRTLSVLGHIGRWHGLVMRVGGYQFYGRIAVPLEAARFEVTCFALRHFAQWFDRSNDRRNFCEVDAPACVAFDTVLRFESALDFESAQ